MWSVCLLSATECHARSLRHKAIFAMDSERLRIGSCIFWPTDTPTVELVPPLSGHVPIGARCA